MPVRLIVLFSLLSLPLAAHDFWIEPATFSPAAGEQVALDLRVGDAFAGEPVARNNPRIERFVLRDARGEREIPGRHGAAPAGYASVHGVGVAAFRTKPVRHGDMPAAKFESYLREEGLETIIAERARRGESAAAGREIYSRSAKSILGDAPDRDAVLSEPFGFRLEIVPVANPRRATTKSIDVRVLFEDQPLENVLVVAIPRSRPSQRVSARTDATGRVQLPGGAGEWMVKAVHMIPAPADSDADWESIWATLTFSRR